MQILNDHDPKPLYYQMIAERGNIFSWTYEEQGPSWWKVTIRKNDTAAGETVGEIAAKDLRKAEVFKKFGIDFCCGGKKSLTQVCKEKGIDEAVLTAELDAMKETPQASNDYAQWQPAFLADYIYNQHHKYYYRENPVIKELLSKVVAHHGPQHPALYKIADAYHVLEQELNNHFAKEETVVFPFVKALAEAEQPGKRNLLKQFPSLNEALNLMEADHEEAGAMLVKIRELANDYTVPEDGCNSYRFLYKKLEDLEADLHLHIHLENNILFPAALKLEKELSNRN
jgi:regulator of cell morphogenesis and NO signaling